MHNICLPGGFDCGVVVPRQARQRGIQHCQDFTLHLQEICILPMGDVNFQGDLTNKYSY